MTSTLSARVDHLLIERQLKAEGFTYSLVSVLNPTAIDSGFVEAIPALCVEAPIILAGAEGIDAVEHNIRIIPVSWWMKEKAQVVINSF